MKQQFKGDIHNVMYWDKALTHKEIRMMCRKKLAAIGVETGRCPHGRRDTQQKYFPKFQFFRPLSAVLTYIFFQFSRLC